MPKIGLIKKINQHICYENISDSSIKNNLKCSNICHNSKVTFGWLGCMDLRRTLKNEETLFFMGEGGWG